ncbi:Wzz/FepE/Etk N-terminal domain-containing protein [Pseudoalteromonas mariniglutinosa]|uniref:Wzz/FepE/Etk N-terminal domain-containing protein n=1 Tax=Pseudoalteromonas mariniglutinosa TaxID=206042 RepID=UPI00384A6D2A
MKVDNSSEITIGFLVKTLWNNKFKVIIPTILVSVLAVFYAINKPNVYTATGVYTPAAQGDASSLSKLAGQFGGLASLAGVNIGGGAEDDTQVAIKFLSSRAFLQHFIGKHSLQDELMAVEGWDKAQNKLVYDTSLYDENTQQWVRTPPPNKKATPTPWEAYEQLKKMLQVQYDNKEGIISINLTYYSPYVAKEWLELIVKELNAFWKEKKLKKSDKLLEGLTKKAQETDVSELQGVFYNLIAEQTKNNLLAQVTDESVFESVGEVVLPEDKSAPSRALICVLAFILSAGVSSLIIIGRAINKVNLSQ